MEEQVILVDSADREIGAAAKMDVHTQGRLHRAFSVVLYNEGGSILLQRRADSKYHSGGLWSNTCCGHPRPGETVSDAACRRLREEMGVECSLEPVTAFLYQTELANGLMEHEYDHIFLGRFSGNPVPNPEEVSEWRWVPVDAVRDDVTTNPQRYTVWFGQVLERCDGLSVEDNRTTVS